MQATAFPADVARPMRFGLLLEALAACLRCAQHLPMARLWVLLRELHEVTLATATVRALTVSVAGKTLWLHVIGDNRATVYRLGARSTVWEGYAGTTVSDRLVSYWRLPKENRRGLCNVHSITA